jgi:probable rRNA maturation factor
VTVVVADERPADDSPDVAVDTGRWEALATAVLDDEAVAGELTLTFVGVDDMAALNAEHMGVTGPTDVLSFPMDVVDDDEQPGVPTLLGDVVISPAVAARQFAEHAGTLDDELALLVVHGILHVLGHDHAEPDETEVMRRRELELLGRHHWHGPPPAGFRQTQD